MKAAVLYGNYDIRYEEYPEPSVKPGYVKVRICACGVCGSDIPRITQGKAHYYPIVLGHECSGYVTEIGDGVTKVHPGDHIAVAPLVPCLDCQDCLKGNYSQCKHYTFIGSRVQGGYADYIVIPELNAVKIDSKIPFEQGALFEPSSVALLPDEVIAERGAILYKACEEAYQEMHPVFVIGSEVPIPGGEVDEEKPECIQVTKVRDFENTLMAYKKKFKEHGLQGAWEHIVAIVVQPGVEFGDETLHHYNRDAAQTLCRALKKYPELVFEGHSTDFQAPVALRQMVEDGIAIIKVGPALTFALREAIFALSMIEDELISDKSQRSNFRRVLEDEMRKEPKYWQSYYAVQENEIKLKLKYSFSDRSRYYMSTSAVETARRQLFENINSNPFPISMLKQYMPLQYVKVRDGLLTLNARELVKDSVKIMIDDYNYAVKQNYTSSQHSVFFV